MNPYLEREAGFAPGTLTAFFRLSAKVDFFAAGFFVVVAFAIVFSFFSPFLGVYTFIDSIVGEMELGKAAGQQFLFWLNNNN